MKEIPTPLKSILLQLKNAKDNDDIDNILDAATKNIKGFIALDNLRYKYGGFEIENILQMYSKMLVQKIKYLNDQHIKSAPELVCYLRIGDDESILVTYKEGCEMFEPIPYRDISKKVDNKAKEAFLSDMTKLAENNMVNKYAAKGTAHWYVNPTTGNIMLDSWHSLQNISPEEKAETIERFKHLLSDEHPF